MEAQKRRGMQRKIFGQQEETISCRDREMISEVETFISVPLGLCGSRSFYLYFCNILSMIPVVD